MAAIEWDHLFPHDDYDKVCKERNEWHAQAEALAEALRDLLDNPWLQAPRDRAFVALVRHPALALAERRAHAEAMALALACVLPFIREPMYYVSDQQVLNCARAALARLPAQVLAERRALEAVATAARLPRNTFIHDDCRFAGRWQAVPQEDFDALRAALAALDAAQAER